MGKVSYQEKMARYSHNSVNTLGDMVLLATLLGVEILKPKAYSRTSVGARKQVEALSDFGKWSNKNHRKVKQTYYRLKRQGLIEMVKTDAVTKPTLTRQGLEKLNSTTPIYHEKRPWDGNLYVITYDIPEKKRWQRDFLRKKLKKLGCGLMQNSVWITPSNPHAILKDHLKHHKLSTSVLIADLATDNGIIGDETVPQLVERIYNLRELNDEYEEFIRDYSRDRHSPSNMYFAYIDILRADPQLPFQLLPSYWLGDKAHRLVKKQLNMQSQLFQ